MIGLSVVPHLHQFNIINLFKEGIRSFFFEKRFDIFEHGLREGPLQNNFVRTLICIVKVRVDLRKLVLYHVRFKIDEFILDVSRREKSPQAILQLTEQGAIRVVRVLVSEGGLGVREGLIQIDFVL